MCIKTIILIFIVVFSATFLDAATYTFNASEGDTIEDINNISLSPGDNVIIRGDYTSSVSLIVNESGNENNRIILSGENFTLNGMNNNISGVVISGDFVTFQNAEIYNFNNNGVSVTKQDPFNPTNNVIIKNVISHNNGQCGFNFSGSVDGVDVYDCTAYENCALIEAHGFSGASSTAWGSDSRGIYNSGGWLQYSGNTYYAENSLFYEIVYNVYAVTDGIEMTEGLNKDSLNPYEYVREGLLLYINIGSNPNEELVTFIRALCKNVNLYDCVAYNNYDVPGDWVEGHGMAFDAWMQDCSMIRCISYENEGHGFSNGRGDNNSYINCLAYKNNLSGFASNTFSGNLNFYFCTSAENVQNGYSIGGTDVVNIKNCIAYDNASTEIGIHESTINSVVSNSCGFDDSGAKISSSGIVNNNIETNPLLNLDYTLAINSPCINNGIVIEGVNLDINKNNRKIGRSVDMGCYEHKNVSKINNIKGYININ